MRLSPSDYVFTETEEHSGVSSHISNSLLTECLAVSHPEISAQWHPEKNGDLTPFDVSPGTHKKAWWICKEGHEWEAQVRSRTRGNRCPVCTRRKLVSGENDLATTHPNLVKEWHPELNKNLNACDVMSGSTRRIWWTCEKKHVWQATIASRVKGAGCPVCSSRVVVPDFNDLTSLYPSLASQWNYEKNGLLKPENVTPYSNKKVWWRCSLGHEYQAVIASRTNDGNGCPYCSGRRVLPGFNDLGTRYPKVAAQWHKDLNGNLTPENVTCGSKKRIWWKCELGHVWKAVIYSRTGGSTGCPTCAEKTNSKYYNVDPKVLEAKVLASKESNV